MDSRKNIFPLMKRYKPLYKLELVLVVQVIAGLLLFIQEIHFISLPFIIPTTGTPNYRAFNNRKFWRMMKNAPVITGMILASLLLFMNSCEKIT